MAEARRPALVFGLQPAGLALARSLGRRGVPVTGVALETADFGLSSRYLRERHLVLETDRGRRDEEVLRLLRTLAEQGRPVFFPERDAHVDFVLRHWDDVRSLADVPLPPAPESVRLLRGKESLPELATRTGIATPATVALESEVALREPELERPFLLKPLDSERYALTFGRKAVLVSDADGAVAAWREARERGFSMVAQELVPDAEKRVYSLFAYVGRAGEPLGSVVGRKARQGPLRFGSSTVFEVAFDPDVRELGLALLDSVGYRGFAHVELVRDPRDGALKLLEVNTRLPVWAGVAMSRHYDLAPVVYADLCGEAVEPLPTFTEPVCWVYGAKDAVVGARLARRRELRLREFARPYRGPKVRAVLASDDRRPTLALLRWLGTRAVEKVRR